jgi:spore germination protein KA
MRIPRRRLRQSGNNHCSPDTVLYKDLQENLTRIKTDFGQNDDLVVNCSERTASSSLTAACIYIDTLVDKNTVNHLSEELMTIKSGPDQETDNLFILIRRHFSSIRGLKTGAKFIDLYAELLSGNTVFLANGNTEYLSIPTESKDSRAIEEPSSQTVIRGPKEGFSERINTNILLVRKRIKSHHAKLENLTVGNLTRTAVSLMYIENIANGTIVREIRRRISEIETDSILESSYIEEWIKDDRYSIFPEFLSSEKPDTVAAAVLEGKVAIFVDGSPYALTAPAVFVEFLHSSEDFYHHYIVSSMIRLLRFISLFLTLLTPSAYIAITTFHQEIIPTPLLISIASQREGVPFPTFIEAFLMELTFEVLREAGVRMPRAIGPAISIVGALVLGQAAVEAGIISAAMVIIVSITAIYSFVVTNYEMSNAVRILRFIFMVLGGFLGLYGVFMGLIILTLHLCKLKSVGTPYLMPLAPWIKNENKDSLLRFPLWSMKYRSFGIGGADRRKVGGSQ